MVYLFVSLLYIDPPPSKNNGLKTTTFLENEWPTFLANYATIPNDIVIVGEINFHLDIVDDRDAQRFIGILDLYGLHYNNMFVSLHMFMVTHWTLS